MRRWTQRECSDAGLRDAEDTVDHDDAQLSLLEWGGIAPRTALELPGQARTLEIPRQDEPSATIAVVL